MDKLLEEMFKRERWEKAIATAVDKNMPYSELENFCSPAFLGKLYKLIKDNEYSIIPPHQQSIPKDDGGVRIVYINENVDRIILSIINDMLFEFCGSLISERSKAYQINLSCGKVVREVVSQINGCKLETIGIKADLSKYFDSVPLKFIEEVFDKVEDIVGKSAVVNLLRRYYECDLCLNEKGEVIRNK
jgi:retron-type reverse transcriptase